MPRINKLYSWLDSAPRAISCISNKCETFEHFNLLIYENARVIIIIYADDIWPNFMFTMFRECFWCILPQQHQTQINWCLRRTAQCSATSKHIKLSCFLNFIEPFMYISDGAYDVALQIQYNVCICVCICVQFKLHF